MEKIIQFSLGFGIVLVSSFSYGQEIKKEEKQVVPVQKQEVKSKEIEQHKTVTKATPVEKPAAEPAQPEENSLKQSSQSQPQAQSPQKQEQKVTEQEETNEKVNIKEVKKIDPKTQTPPVKKETQAVKETPAPLNEKVAPPKEY